MFRKIVWFFFIHQAWKIWSKGIFAAEEFVDPTFGDNYQIEQVTRCIHIALLCVQADRADRLKICKINSMLTSSKISLPAPHEPGFLVPSRRAWICFWQLANWFIILDIMNGVCVCVTYFVCVFVFDRWLMLYFVHLSFEGWWKFSRGDEKFSGWNCQSITQKCYQFG